MTKNINFIKWLGHLWLVLICIGLGVYYIGYDKLPTKFLFIPNLISVIWGAASFRAGYAATRLDKITELFSKLEKAEVLAVARQSASADEKFLKEYDEAVPIITEWNAEIKHAIFYNYFYASLCLKIGIIGGLVELLVNNDINMAIYQCGFGLLAQIIVQVQTAFLEQKVNE